MRHAMEIPGAALAALREYAAVRQHDAGRSQVDALCAGKGPLSAGERQVLEDALGWWLQQHAAAGERVREIRARLDIR
jgi:hypothetical protein